MPQETVGYVELEWTCEHCGTKNPGTRQVCSNCGAPMNERQKFELAAQQKLITDKDLIAKAEAGPDIICPFCGTRNVVGATKCVHCGGDLTGATARAKGEVLGAFTTAPQPEIKCRYCGTMNPADAKKCKTCGSALVREAAPATPVAKAATAAGGIGILPIVIIGALIVACLGFFILSSRTSDTVGTVRGVEWQRNIAVLAQRPVTREDWRDRIPSGARVGQCQQRVRGTQDQPVANSQKVCGTPYTIDEGTGVGKVVQDCVYNVYDDYCEYSTQQWVVIDTVVARGQDANPRWPSPALSADQRFGQRDENYVVIFTAGDKTYQYQPRSEAEFARFTPGSRWRLKINGLGSITSVEPAT
jgi:ribosomal protein L40E